MGSKSYDEQLAEIVSQEAELQFDEFSNDQALALGLALVDAARAKKAAVTIDITRSGQQLFHYAFAGTSADNDQWIVRKNRVVGRFGRSSLRVGIQLKRDDTNIADKYYLDPREYSAHGGAFPLTLRGTGVVGTVTVSGLPQEEDHALVAETIRTFLRRA